MCHVSHVYETGASLYFTLIARQREGDEIGQWRAVKQAAGDAILAGGGTITHHHAVGRDHARWMLAGGRRGGVAALRALKSELDPAGIMNPGKLLERQPLRLNGPRRTTWPGWVGWGLVSLVSSISWNSPALLGSSEPPARRWVEPTAELLLSGRELVGELYSQTA